VFACNADLTGWWVFSGEWETARGEVMGVEKTLFSEGGSKHRRGTPVYAIHYEFMVDGERHEGVSYVKGKRAEAGRTVTVEFPRGTPGSSRLQGLRRAPVGAVPALITPIFPMVGLVFVIIGWRRGGRGVRLLRHGVLARGRFKSKEATRTRVNRQTVYKLTFEFEVDGRIYQASARTHETERLQDEEEELLLYDPLDPRRAVMLDGLPGRPRIDDNGFIRVESVSRSLMVLVFPVATLVGHGLYFIFGR
jgi:hypothetical protein